MRKKITLVTTGHPPYDERIYWKFANSLINEGFDISIICSTSNIKETNNKISIIGFDGSMLSRKSKNYRLFELISNEQPDIVICCEPMAVFAANNYKRKKKSSTKIILDVTEWYPENVTSKLSFIKQLIFYPILTLINILASNISDHIIVGEVSKKRRYDILSPTKQKTIIGYYPVLKYFPSRPPTPTPDNITLGYAGLINFDRGILTLLNIAQKLAKNNLDKNVTLKIIGKFQYKKEEEIFNKICENISIIRLIRKDWVSYSELANQISDIDLCFDLRKQNFIYRNSLPIKIFEYLACGKPVIYSDIKPIRKELEIEKIGNLVNPNAEDQIIKIIESYWENPNKLRQQSVNARDIIEKGKNWESESHKLIELVSTI